MTLDDLDLLVFTIPYTLEIVLFLFTFKSHPNSKQLTINKLENWANNSGFRLSIDKTYIVHFCNKRNLHPDPQLTLYNHPIPVTSEFKFLGVVFDNKLAFLPRDAL